MTAHEHEDDLTYTKSKRTLQSTFIIGATVIVSLVAIITVVLDYVFMRLAVLDEQTSWIIPGLGIGLASIIAGVALSLLASHFYLKPINGLIDGMSLLADGKFDARLTYKGSEEIARIYDGFNKLAAELQNVEILRSDFINNFSHEIKTPIMSINGLIGLLKSKNLSKEKQIEYLNIIEEETKRLSFITTNILNMTKIENQGIITDKHEYNVSEQMRMCVLLFEKQWGQKNLELSMDFDDYTIEANEDMLKQVWINLLDNAIKFAYDGGELSVSMQKTDGELTVEIGDTGPEIAEPDREKIFNKFYQVDRSHTLSGNGIGLSVVKRIVELHGGSVSCRSGDGKTVFKVVLPTA